MDDPTNTDDTSISDDQRAVADYFSTPGYERLRRDELPPRSLLFDQALPVDRSMSPVTSFWLGLIGLNVILVFFACMMPLGMKVLEDFINRPIGFFLQSIVIQTIALPPIISFSFASVTPMFWYGPVLRRFVVAGLMATLGCLAFIGTFDLIDEHVDHEMSFQVSAVMFVHFLTAGAVALTIQMWSPWTLTHNRIPDSPIPPLGTRSMMELTVVAAIGYAVFVTVDMEDVVEGLMFFCAMGLFCSLAVIAVLIALLRRGHRNQRAAVIAGCFCFAAAAMISGFIAVIEFGWNALRYEFPMVGLASIYGAALIFGVMWLCLWWLRRCGWRCVSREEEKRRIEQRETSSALL